MPPVTVRPVRTRRDRKNFLDFPFTLYRGNDLWVPPILREEAALVGYRPHPYHANNLVQTFLAYRGGVIVGRIAAVHDSRHVAQFHDGTGFIGFFECRDDLEAASALFDAAAEWLRARGLHRLRGPMNPSLHYTAGLLVEGFEHAPTFMMPYNPPYYARLFESCGFSKAQDLYAYRGVKEQLPTVEPTLYELGERITKWYDIKFRPLNRRRLRQDVREFLSVINQSLVGHWGFTPFSDAEMDQTAGGLTWLLVPSLAVGAEIEGRLVGVMLVLPDYNPCIRRSRGRLFPWGLIRMLWNRRRIRNFRVIACNVLPEYHRMGVGLALGTIAFRNSQKWIAGSEVEFSWVAESNKASRGALEKSGTTRTKVYRIYDREEPGSATAARQATTGAIGRS